MVGTRLGLTYRKTLEGHILDAINVPQACLENIRTDERDRIAFGSEYLGQRAQWSDVAVEGKGREDEMDVGQW